MQNLQSGMWSSKVTGWQQCPTSPDPFVLNACSEGWALESVALACSTAYVDQTGARIQDGFDLEDPYYNFAYPVAEMQIAKGGIRLANVINALFASEAMAEYVLPREQFLRNQKTSAPRVADEKNRTSTNGPTLSLLSSKLPSSSNLSALWLAGSL